MYKTIDIESWPRKELFLFFKKYDNPTWDIAADVRINYFYEAVKDLDTSFFLSFLFVASRVCNDIAALKQRIDSDGNILEYETVHPGSTILYDNGTFGFGYFQFEKKYELFLSEAAMVFEEQKIKKDLDPKEEDLARIHFSPIPWISFSVFRHPFNATANHSIPKIVFGKPIEKNTDRMMPVGITLHHGLADGYHTGLFFNQLQNELDDPWRYMNIPR
jgi:chloramphenicol O-acetyltransferase type A